MARAAWATVAELQDFLRGAGLISAQNEVQTVTISGASGGSSIWTFSTVATAGIAWNASAAAVQAALEALSNVDSGDVAVTGPAGGPYRIVFGGQYRFTDLALISVNTGGLTGSGISTTVAETVRGVALSDVEMLYDYSGALAEAVDWWETITNWKPFLAAPTARQYVLVSGGPTAGGYTLDFGAGTSASIAFNASASSLQAILEAVTQIGTGKVSVSGDAGGPYTIDFADSVTLAWLTLHTNSLSGGISPGIVVGEAPLKHNAPNGRSLVLNSGFTLVGGVFSGVVGNDFGVPWQKDLHYRERHWLANPQYPIDALLFGSLFSGYYSSASIRDSGLYGGPLSLNVIGRQGFADTVPDLAWSAVRDNAAWRLISFLGTAQASEGGVIQWQKGDVQEEYGKRGPYGYLLDVLESRQANAVRQFRRQMQG